MSRVDLPRRDESFRDAALIKYLDGAGEKTPGSRAVEILTDASFDDDDVDPQQRQLAANISPVGPPPAITTACSVIAAPRRAPHRIGTATSRRATAPAPVATLPRNFSTGSVQRSRSTHLPRQHTHPTTPGSKGSGRNRLSERVHGQHVWVACGKFPPSRHIFTGGVGPCSTMRGELIGPYFGDAE